MIIFSSTCLERERAIPFELSADSSEKRAARAYDLHVAEGIKRGIAQFDKGEFVSRADSESVRRDGSSTSVA